MAIHNLEAEQSVLGCILLDQSAIKEIQLLPEHFFDTRHSLIFRAMKSLERKEIVIDIRTVASALDASELENVGDVRYIADLLSAVPYAKNFKVYEKLVMDAWKLRQAEQLAHRLLEEIATNRQVESITEAIQDLSRLDEVGYEEDFDLKQALSYLFESLENNAKSQGLAGINTGFSDLNTMTFGWKDQELIVIGGRPAMGKSAFAIETGIQALQRGVVVSFFSLEMSKEELLKRMVSQIGMIDASKMQNAKKIDGDDWTKITLSIGRLSDLQLYIYDKPSITIQEMRAKIRRLHRLHPEQKHLTILDYLQLVKVSGSGGNRVQEIGEISRELKLMAREFNQPLIALSQLSRSVEQRQDKRPIMSDIRESGNIEQDADKILFLYRDDYYNEDSKKKNIVEIKIAKHRNGPVGMVELVFLRNFNKFQDFAKRGE